MLLQTPVALFIFNRPDLTVRVFEAIAQAKPTQLFVIADGPRHDSEAELCSECREIIERVDWPCDIRTNFSDVNLGCKNRVSSGLDWVFSQVEQAIILEDDCLPSLSFFKFCEQMLDDYKDDTRIMHISGSNFVPSGLIESSYYFSRYIHIWGWATWRRAWQHYDVTMAKWPEVRENILASCVDKAEASYWDKFFTAVYKGEIDTWDCQWHLTCWQQSGLSIVPRENLISNIGFRDDATHTRGTSPFANLPVGIWSQSGDKPPYVMPDFCADAADRSNWITPTSNSNWSRRIYKRLGRLSSRKSTP
jgi:hypothetical protein